MPPPGGHEPEHFDWSRIEDDLGLRLPGDYKRFLEKYGLGKIDNFMIVFHPTTPNRHLNLKKKIDDELSAAFAGSPGWR